MWSGASSLPSGASVRENHPPEASGTCRVAAARRCWCGHAGDGGLLGEAPLLAALRVEGAHDRRALIGRDFLRTRDEDPSVIVEHDAPKVVVEPGQAVEGTPPQLLAPG